MTRADLTSSVNACSRQGESFGDACRVGRASRHCATRHRRCSRELASRVARTRRPLSGRHCCNRRAHFGATRAPSVYRARVETRKAQFVMEIDRAWAPLGADRFYNLSAPATTTTRGSRASCPSYIAQFGIARRLGDQRGVGRANVSGRFGAPLNVRGTVAFAMTGPNARTTQLYINLVDNTRIDAQGFSPMGRVVEGMAVVDSLYSATARTPAAACARGSRARSSTAATPTSTANSRSWTGW